MNRVPNYADVVTGTLSRVLKQAGEWDNEGLYYADLSDDLLNNYFPKYVIQGDFTVALLCRVKDQVTEFVGVSKRNVRDPRIPLRGKSLALARAIRTYALTQMQKTSEDAQ